MSAGLKYGSAEQKLASTKIKNNDISQNKDKSLVSNFNMMTTDFNGKPIVFK